MSEIYSKSKSDISEGNKKEKESSVLDNLIEQFKYEMENHFRNTNRVFYIKERLHSEPTKENSCDEKKCTPEGYIGNLATLIDDFARTNSRLSSEISRLESLI